MRRIERSSAARGPAPALLLALLLAWGAAGQTAVSGSGQQIAFEDVVANLRVGEPGVRLDALALLGKAGFLEAAVPVAALLTDGVSAVQERAIETEVALFLADEAYTRSYAGKIVKQRGASLPLLAFAQGEGALIANPVPADVVRGLVGAVASQVPAVQFNAAYALGIFGPGVMARGPLPDGKAAVERLVGMARASDPALRLAATHVIGRLYERAGTGHPALLAARPDAGDQLVSGMNDPDPLVRTASIRAIGAMRYDRAVQALTDQLGYYKKGEPARELLAALARVAHPSSLSVFSALLDDRDEQIRRLAVEGIGRAGDDEAFYNLEIRTARDKSKFVKQALAFLRVRQGEPAALGVVMDGFRNIRLAPVAWDYLVELGPAVGPGLAAFANHKDWRVRAAVAEALGVVGHSDSLVVVEGLSRDGNKNVSAAARRSLLRLSPRPAGAPRIQ